MNAIDLSVRSFKTSIGNKLLYAKDEYAALVGADALVIGTDWQQFKAPDFEKIRCALKYPVIFDNKSLFRQTDQLDCLGFAYFGIGVENELARSYHRKLGK